jgi:hypothetical protein
MNATSTPFGRPDVVLFHPREYLALIMLLLLGAFIPCDASVHPALLNSEFLANRRRARVDSDIRKHSFLCRNPVLDMFTSTSLLLLTAALAKAANITTQVVADGYTYTSLGCYADRSESRVLRAATFNDDNDFQLEDCIPYCSRKGYEFAGLEFGRECYCDWRIHNNPPRTTLDECNSPCTGENNIVCGGPNRVQIFYRDPRFLPPTISPIENGFEFFGCYTDNVQRRTLERRVPIDGGLTVAKCTAACKAANFTYAGVEFGEECYCGNTVRSPGTLTDLDSCDMQCSGDFKHLCGAADRVIIYHYH